MFRVTGVLPTLAAMQSNEVPTVRGGVDNVLFSLPSSLALTTVGVRRCFRTKLLLNTPTASSKNKAQSGEARFSWNEHHGLRDQGLPSKRPDRRRLYDASQIPWVAVAAWSRHAFRGGNVCGRYDRDLAFRWGTASEDKYRGLSAARRTMKLSAASVEMTCFFTRNDALVGYLASLAMAVRTTSLVRSSGRTSAGALGSAG